MSLFEPSDACLPFYRVAKVTESAVTHLALHPRSDTLLAAAGDKGGKIGEGTSLASIPSPAWPDPRCHAGLWHCFHDSFALEPDVPAVGPSAPSARTKGQQDHGRGEGDMKVEEEAAAAAEDDNTVDFESDHGCFLFDVHDAYISGLK